MGRTEMPFETLPEFPNGGEVSSRHGAPGLPPESFQQALRDQGVNLIESTKRPEDLPAVQAAIESQVDTVARQMGQAMPPEFAQQQVPGQPDTPVAQQPAAPRVQPSPANQGAFEDRIRRVMEKYSSPEKLAEAYDHAQRALTQTGQHRARELADMRTHIQDLERRLEERATMYVPPPPAAAAMDPNMPTGHTSGAVPDDPEEFFKQPAKNFRTLVRDVVRNEIEQLNEASRIAQEETAFESKREANAQRIEALRPFMNQVYQQDIDLYESLPKDRALDILLERASERYEAQRARQLFQELQNEGLMGGPAHAAPQTQGALPSGNGTVRRSGSPQAISDWSNTPAFNRLWKSRSESVEEDRSIMDILRERGFGEDIT